jgi:hypothetical protein
MTLYEFRAEKDRHGFGGYVEADDMIHALVRLAELGFTNPTYLALAIEHEAGAPIYHKEK